MCPPTITRLSAYVSTNIHTAVSECVHQHSHGCQRMCPPSITRRGCQRMCPPTITRLSAYMSTNNHTAVSVCVHQLPHGCQRMCPSTITRLSAYASIPLTRENDSLDMIYNPSSMDESYLDLYKVSDIPS